MSTKFTPATRANVPLLLGFSGGTGSGKTWTSMEVATGICGDKPFAVIDTETGRARHYAEYFRFDHAELRAPFRPEAYLDAIISADEAGYPAVVVDSMSHVWAGEGGVLDWQEEELERMAGDNWQKREACKMAAWIKPKTAHKRMVQRLLQVRTHIILCFRAEPKVDIIKEDGKTKIVPKVSLTGLDGWIPICEKNLPYELTASFLLMAGKPGVVHPIKLQEQHRSFFPLDKPIGRQTGVLLAQWAKGGTATTTTTTTTTTTQPTDQPNRDLAALEDIATTKIVEGNAALVTWGATLTVAEKKLIGKNRWADWLAKTV